MNFQIPRDNFQNTINSNPERKFQRDETAKNYTLGGIKENLYALLTTAHFLKTQFDSGMVDSSFYFRKMNSFLQELNSLEEAAKSSNSNLRRLIDEIPVDNQVKNCVTVIYSIKDYRYQPSSPIQDSQTQNRPQEPQWDLDPLQMGGAVANITSNFITLTDYLHLIDSIDIPLLFDLVNALKDSLAQYNTFTPFIQDVDSILHYIAQLSDYELSSKETIKNIEDLFYTVLVNFKQTLNGQ